MKIILSILAGLVMSAASLASTSITTTTVSGHWTVANSPYLIFNDIVLTNSTSLIIDPGVQVVFQGYYKFVVFGSLIATGTSASPIVFTVQDTTGSSLDTCMTCNAGGWAGITFASFPGPFDTCSFSFCNISYMKNAEVYIQRSLHISDCEFLHNMEYAYPVINFDGSYDSLAVFELNNCNIHDNSLLAEFGIGAYLGTTNIHDNDIHDNHALGATVINLTNTNVMLKDNNIYNNGLLADSGADITVATWTCKGIIQGNKIYNNICRQQGVVWIVDSKIDVNSNYICNNQSLLYSVFSGCGVVEGGGAIRVSGQNVSLHNVTTIRNNIIANNYGAFDGGAIYIIYASVDIFNNDIVNNTSYGGSGGIHIINQPSAYGPKMVRIKNNIFLNNVSLTGNDTVNLSMLFCDSLEFDHNWTQRPFYRDFFTGSLPPSYLIGDTATNMTGTNPSLVAPTLTASPTESALTADFHLYAPSFCINQGDNSVVNASERDYAGSIRMWNGTVDIGAYEYGSHLLSVIPVASYVKQQIAVYPNPATGCISINTPEASGAIAVIDISGKILLTKEVNSTLSTVDVSTLTRGLYFVTWKNNNGIGATQKLIVQ